MQGEIPYISENDSGSYKSMGSSYAETIPAFFCSMKQPKCRKALRINKKGKAGKVYECKEQKGQQGLPDAGKEPPQAPCCGNRRRIPKEFQPGNSLKACIQPPKGEKGGMMDVC